MKEIEKSKNNSKNNGNKSGEKKKIPIIQTLKPKKRYTKLEKELIEAGQAVMDAIIKQQNAKV
ncbi:hypothetical protein BH20ACI1_BH20ACI1_30350 [soil metagenome]